MQKYTLFSIKLIGLCALLIGWSMLASCQSPSQSQKQQNSVIPEMCPGICQIDRLVEAFSGETIGLVVNHTSQINGVHLVDTLLARGVRVRAIFAPEHGFKGEADAGARIRDGLYQDSIPVYSLYGATKKPTPDMLSGVDHVLFDIQDVGVRFYTYISTLHYVMEAAAEATIPVTVLDRPNPHAHYIDGPVRQKEWKSFVGMHSVPIVYGMTIGEYAKMINGERWMANGIQCELEVVTVSDYDRQQLYDITIPPSPNLPNLRSILLYPSLCLMEGSTISLGRGTTSQFQQWGHPALVNQYAHHFTPVKSPGAKYPKHENKTCYGMDLSELSIARLHDNAKLNFQYLIEAHEAMKRADATFYNDNNFFEKLAGTAALRSQLAAGLSEAEIRESWKTDLRAFAQIRKKYLLY